MERTDKNVQKIQVFDIQAKMQKLSESIQPVQVQIQELDRKRLALIAEILKEVPEPTRDPLEPLDTKDLNSVP